MNREEAIRRLRYIRMDYLGYPPFLEPIDMAIEALSAENSNAKTQNSNQETQNSNGEIIKWLESLKAEIGKSEHRTLWHYAEAIDMAIEALQTIDNCDQCEWCCPSDGTPTIHVVRCKDCRHRDLFSCPLADNDFQKDEDFCSWGERREP